MIGPRSDTRRLFQEAEKKEQEKKVEKREIVSSETESSSFEVPYIPHFPQPSKHALQSMFK